MLLENRLSGASLATYVAPASANSQTCPTHTKNICQRFFCATYPFYKGSSYLERSKKTFC